MVKPQTLFCLMTDNIAEVLKTHESASTEKTKKTHTPKRKLTIIESSGSKREDRNGEEEDTEEAGR